MLKRCLFSLFLLLFITASAQDDSLVIRSQDTTVQLSWFLPDTIFPDAPFTVERQDAQGGIVRFSVMSPMPLAEVIATNLLSEAEYSELIQEFQAEPATLSAEELENRELARAILTMASITRPNWTKVLGLSYEDSDVSLGETYVYRVSTVIKDQTFELGEAQITVGASQILAFVAELRGIADSNGINLDWTLSAESPFIAYKVYRLNPEGQELELTPDGLFIGLQEDAETGQLSPPEVFLQDTEVSPETSYRYIVTGVDVFGQEGPRSDPIEVFFPDPEPLALAVVQAVDLKDNAVELFWQLPTDQRIAGVAVVRYLDPLGDYEQVSDILPATSTSFTDASVEGGISYYYALLSLDRQGKAFGPGPVWATRAINLDPPQAPKGLTIGVTEEQFELNWQASSEADIAGYQVLLQRSDQAGDQVLLTESYLTESKFSYSVPKGTINDFSFRVRAINTSYVEGLLSEAVSAKLIDKTAPAAPLLTEILAGESAIKISWAFSSDPDIVAYQVLRQKQGDAEFTVIQNALAANVTSFVDKEVSPGLSHIYSLRALDISGNLSERAAPLRAIPYDTQAPTTPALIAEFKDESVILRWQAEASLFYIVERSSASESNFVQISDILLPGSSGYKDVSGRQGYYYRLVAIDTAGNLGLPTVVKVQ